MSNDIPRAMIFGGGNIGRGFIGQLFCESGYEVTFADIDAELIALFNERRSYRLEAVFNEEVETLQIGPVRGVSVTDPDAIDEAVLAARIAATSVGQRALPKVAESLARGLAKRAAAGAPPLNIILCENLKNAARIMRDMVAGHTPPEARDYLDNQVGFVDTVIGRMVPLATPEQRAADPTLVRVEPYKELPVDRRGFRGDIPRIASLIPVDDFAVYTARKLYIHNCGHALFAYQGYLKGDEYGWQSLARPEIRDFLFAGWEESARGIVHKYGADPQWLRDHMEDLYRRFQNRALGDTVFRLARDPVRKLHPTDRLVSPARLAVEAGIVPVHLAEGIAAALCFDAAEDPIAVELQQRLAADGPAPVLREVCEIDPAEPLGQTILTAYRRLRG